MSSCLQLTQGTQAILYGNQNDIFLNKIVRAVPLAIGLTQDEATAMYPDQNRTCFGRT